MKTIYLLAIFFCSLGTLKADNTLYHAFIPTPQEGLMEGQPFDSLEEQIRQDLLDGIWTEIFSLTALDQGKERVFKFNEIGTLEMITVFEDGHSEQTLQVWRLTKKAGKVILELTDMSSDNTRAYQITPSLEGMILKDELLQIEIVWHYQPSNLGGHMQSAIRLPKEISTK